MKNLKEFHKTRTKKEVKMNIGDTVLYNNEYGEKKSGVILEVASDMDSYDDMRLLDGVPYYASKKLTASENKRRKSAKKSVLSEPIYAPVKEKNIDTVFLIVKESNRKTNDFIMFNEVINGETKRVANG